MTMVENEISIEFKNDLSELDQLCRQMEEFGESLMLSKKCCFNIILAMEEICSNIISHGFKDEFEHMIKIDARHQKGILEIRIEDDGIPFNPTAVEPPDLNCPVEEREVGGLGCHLVNSLMDDVQYQRVGNKNILILKKDIKESS
jgi:anti-sigma regulatory factor (Ser/Thr protein kinase)